LDYGLSSLQKPKSEKKEGPHYHFSPAFFFPPSLICVTNKKSFPPIISAVLTSLQFHVVDFTVVHGLHSNKNYHLQIAVMADGDDLFFQVMETFFLSYLTYILR
jgi:hypothetical protein